MWQNLRRAMGYRVQYFAVVEPQRRLAPHLHAAVRGAIPRALFRQVAAATYHQVWWPAFDMPRYVEELPVWLDDVGYVDPESGAVLPTWRQAVEALEEESGPVHVLRFGKQMDLQGIVATEGDADRRVAYLTKYLAKGFAEAFADEDERLEAAAGSSAAVARGGPLVAVLAAVLELAAVRRPARGCASGDGAGVVSGEGARRVPPGLWWPAGAGVAVVDREDVAAASRGPGRGGAPGAAGCGDRGAGDRPALGAGEVCGWDAAVRVAGLRPVGLDGADLPAGDDQGDQRADAVEGGVRGGEGACQSALMAR